MYTIKKRERCFIVTIGAFFTLVVPVFLIAWLWDAHDRGVKEANKIAEDNWGCGIGCFLICTVILAIFVILCGFIAAL